MATASNLAKPALDGAAPSRSVGRRLVRNVSWSVAGSASAQGSSLLAAFVLGRQLGVNGFGQIALIQATVLMLGTFGEMGLSLTTTKFVGRWRTEYPDRAGSLIGWSLRITAMSAVCIAIASAVFGPRLSMAGFSGLTNEIRAGSVLLIFDMLGRVQMGALAGLEAFDSTARVNACRAVLMLPCVWVGTRAGGLFGAVAAMAFVSFAVFAVGHAVLRAKCRSLSIRLRYRASRQTGVLATSASLSATNLLMAGSTWVITLWLAGGRAGVGELGLFNAADKWKTALLFLPQMLFQVTLPMLSHAHAEGDYAACGRIVRGALVSTLAVTGAGALCMLSLSGTLMSSYGRDFTRGAGVLSIAAAAAVAGGLYTVGSGALWALGRPAQMVWIDLVRTVLLLGLSGFGFGSSASRMMLAFVIAQALACVVLLNAIRVCLRRQEQCCQARY